MEAGRAGPLLAFSHFSSLDSSHGMVLSTFRVSRSLQLTSLANTVTNTSRDVILSPGGLIGTCTTTALLFREQVDSCLLIRPSPLPSLPRRGFP